ncbi:hypothetical protein LJC42_07005 [Eubacteriales bacterium OttesenSCG-928-K08]|nr:hypothetical protein [Eubacteriales bacterium OttesenSCG-928-K08]
MKQGVTIQEFIAKLEELLRLTRNNVERLELEQNVRGTYVNIVYANGFSRKVDITCDSGIAIIKDVAARV